MKRLVLILFIIAAAALCLLPAISFGQTVGQIGIPQWTSSGITYNWMTKQNSKVIGINGSGQVELVTSGGGGTLGGLSDVALNSNTSGQLLRFNGTSWVNWTPDFQAGNANLTALAGATSAADTLFYFTGSGAGASTAFTSAARTLLDDSSVSVMRGTLGIGSMGTQNSASVNITGGSIAGVSFGVGITFGNVALPNGGNISFADGDGDLLEIYSNHTTPQILELPNASGTVLLSSSNLDATKLTGNLAVARFNGGTGASSSTFLRGDMTWASVATGLTIGTTAITSGTSGRVLYDNAGVLGQVTGITLSSGALSALSVGAGSFSTPAITFGGSSAGIYLSTATTGILSFRENGYNGFRFLDTDGNIFTMTLASSLGFNFNGGTRVGAMAGIGFISFASSGTYDTHWMRGASAATLQAGVNHATVATNQVIKAHNVTTGTGAGLDLRGGTGSVAGGEVTISTSDTTTYSVRMRVKASGVINMPALPTSSAGLSSGDLWNDSGVVKIVP